MKFPIESKPLAPARLAGLLWVAVVSSTAFSIAAQSNPLERLRQQAERARKQLEEQAEKLRPAAPATPTSTPPTRRKRGEGGAPPATGAPAQDPSPSPGPAPVAGLSLPEFTKDRRWLESEVPREFSEAGRLVRTDPLRAWQHATRGGYLRGWQDVVERLGVIERDIAKLRAEQQDYTAVGAVDQAQEKEKRIAALAANARNVASIATLRGAAGHGSIHGHGGVPGQFAPFLASFADGDTAASVTKELVEFREEMIRCKGQAAPEVGARAMAEAKVATAILAAIEKGDLAAAQTQLDAKWEQITGLPAVHTAPSTQRIESSGAKSSGTDAAGVAPARAAPAPEPPAVDPRPAAAMAQPKTEAELQALSVEARRLQRIDDGWIDYQVAHTRWHFWNTIAARIRQRDQVRSRLEQTAARRAHYAELGNAEQVAQLDRQIADAEKQFDALAHPTVAALRGSIGANDVACFLLFFTDVRLPDVWADLAQLRDALTRYAVDRAKTEAGRTSATRWIPRIDAILQALDAGRLDDAQQLANAAWDEVLGTGGGAVSVVPANASKATVELVVPVLPAAATAPQVTKLVAIGDAAPGATTAGAFYKYLQEPCTSGAGHVAFRGGLATPGNRTRKLTTLKENGRGVWVAGPSGVTLVALSNTAAPGADDVELDHFPSFAVGKDGSIVVHASLAVPRDVRRQIKKDRQAQRVVHPEHALLAGFPGQSLATVILCPSAVPGGGAAEFQSLVEPLAAPLLDRNGVLVAAAHILEPGGAATPSLWCGKPGALARVVASPAADDGNLAPLRGSAWRSGSGQFVVLGSTGDRAPLALWVQGAQGLEPVAEVGAPCALVDGLRYRRLEGLSLADDGMFALRAGLEGRGHSESAVLAFRDGALRVVARARAPLVEGVEIVDVQGTPSAAEGGVVAFAATCQLGDGGSAVQTAWVARGAALTPIWRAGDRAPGTAEGIVFDHLVEDSARTPLVCCNAAGQAVFAADVRQDRLQGERVTDNARGLWAWNGTHLGLVARVGDELEVAPGTRRVLKTLSLVGPRPLTDDGRVIVWATWRTTHDDEDRVELEGDIQGASAGLYAIALPK